MTTEVITDVTAIVAREQDQADDVRAALETAITVLQAADIDTSDSDAETFRGIGIARTVYPLLEQAESLVKKVRSRAERVIGAYLTQSGSTGAVLGGVPYTFKGTPSTYVYEAEKLHRALRGLVGHVITEDEFRIVAPAIVIPEQVIPAHTEYRIDGAALSRIVKKRGGEPVRVGDDNEVMTFEQVVDQFRQRDPGVPRLRQEGDK